MNAKLLPLALVALLLLAGCTGKPGLFNPQSGKAVRYNGTLHFPPPVATNATGALVALPAWAKDNATLPVPIEQLAGLAGAEPNLGITSKGSLFVTTFDNLQRSKDQGRTWQDVWDYVTPGYPTTEDVLTTSDPMMWVDPDTDRVFVDHMISTQCTWMAFSDSDGDPGTFIDRPALCDIPTIDHQKIVTAHYGPGLPKVPNPVYPNVFYMCSNKIDFGTWCATSFDGGLSFQSMGPIVPQDTLCGNINGHPAAFPDGTVVVPLGGALGGADCNRPPTLYVTETDGLGIPANPAGQAGQPGWTQRVCYADDLQTEVDPDITVTPDGTAYMVYRGADQHHHLLRTKDKFQTCDRFPIDPPNVTLGVFNAITSGDDGRIAITWLGTTTPQKPDVYDLNSTPNGPSAAVGGSIWHAYTTTVLDAESADPTFLTQRVTPDEDPVQVGCVWLGGGGGGPHNCRNLLDFIDMVSDKDGRTYAAITDGCTPRNGCAGDLATADYQSRDAQVGILVQDHGVSLRGNATLPSLGLQPPQPFPE